MYPPEYTYIGINYAYVHKKGFQLWLNQFLIISSFNNQQN